MEKVFVKPAREGVKVYNVQANANHPPAGEWVTETPYILRRIAEGDLAVCEPPAASAAESAPEPTAEQPNRPKKEKK